MEALTLLAGDARTFVTEVWASRVHVHQGSPDALASLLTLDDVDHLLTSSGIRTPAVRVVRDGTVVPPTTYTRRATLAGQPVTGLVDGRAVLDLFADGATLVLQGLHRSWPPLTELTRSLELALGHPCQVNAYLTPPAAQGFALHRDTHDVFVVQTAGHKRWTLGEEGDQAQLDLLPGMSVYLPTGTPHAARSESDTSLHVTVGINRVTWRELLTRVTAQVLRDASYDEPIPAGYLAEPEVLEKALTDRLTALRGAMADLDPADLTRQRFETFLTTRRPTLAGSLADLTRLTGIHAETRLRRRSPALAVLPDDGPATEDGGDDGRLRVLTGDRELRMPARLRPAMEHLCLSLVVTPAELPGLTPADALVLTRRLVREGVLGIEQ